jgi:Phage integrase, N-terminal SAM-like domain
VVKKKSAERKFCLVPLDFMIECWGFCWICQCFALRPAAVQFQEKAEGRRRMLSDVAHEKLRAGHYSRRTEEAYWEWIRRFIRFHRGRHPRELREAGVVAFLEDLAGRRALR